MNNLLSWTQTHQICLNSIDSLVQIFKSSKLKMWCVHTFHEFYIVMQHIHPEHQQFSNPFTSSLCLIFDLQIAQYNKIFIGNSMVILKHSKVVIAIFSNRPYGEIASDSIRSD